MIVFQNTEESMHSESQTGFILSAAYTPADHTPTQGAEIVWKEKNTISEVHYSLNILIVKLHSNLQQVTNQEPGHLNTECRDQNKHTSQSLVHNLGRPNQVPKNVQSN